MPTRPAPAAKVKAIRRLLREGLSFRQVAAEVGVSASSVAHYAKSLAPNDHGRRAALPDPVARDTSPVRLDRPGWWLVLSDVHAPYHDRATVELAVAEARKRKAVGVLLNGDFLDSHEVSDHDKDPRAARYVEEVECGKQILTWVRKQLPKADVWLKEGNHEERLTRYVLARAPALFDLEGVSVPELLHCADLGVEWVGDRRVIELGRLNVVHGHEYRGGVSTPVNPARGLYLKARDVTLCGHWHKTSEHHERDIRGRHQAAWSSGCACDLKPRYAPLNSWNLGYTFVHLGADGWFEVNNRRVIDGRVI